jgi:hypothetical protein
MEWSVSDSGELSVKSIFEGRDWKRRGYGLVSGFRMEHGLSGVQAR